MEPFNRYVTLTKILFKDSFGISKHTKQQNEVGESKTKKFFGKVGLAFAVIIVLAVMVVSTISMTMTASHSGIIEEMVYALVGLGQLVVLFFGSILALNTLYFNKDNPLLSSLPIEAGVVFSAKFTITYVSELLFSAIILVPTMTTAGVTLSLIGHAVPWYWYLLEIFAVITVPVIPLVVVSIISLPLMYVVSYMKNKNTLRTIVNFVVYGASIAVYLLIMMFVENAVDEETGMMTTGAISIFVGVKKATIFNYPSVNALLGNNAGLNLLYYALGIIAIMGIAIGVSALFYKRALALQSEGGATTDNKKTKGAKKENVKNTLVKSLMIKEFRVVLHNPTLLINAIMGVVLPVIMGFIFSLTGMTGAPIEGEEGVPPTFMIAVATYAFYIVVSVSNPIAPIAFSLEGKNLSVLKSLPISAMDLIKAKLLVADIFTAITAVSMGILFPLVAKYMDVSVIIGLTLLTFIGGTGFNAVMLRNDLIKPNTGWSNITEITKNNKRVAKPALLAVCVGILFAVIGVVLGLLLTEWSLTAVCALFYGICLVPASVICVIGHINLVKKPEDFFRKIGG